MATAESNSAERPQRANHCRACTATFDVEAWKGGPKASVGQESTDVVIRAQVTVARLLFSKMTFGVKAFPTTVSTFAQAGTLKVQHNPPVVVLKQNLQS